MTPADDRPRCVHGRLVTSPCADCAADHATAKRRERAERDELNGIVHRTTEESVNEALPGDVARVISSMFGGRISGVEVVRGTLECAHAREVKRLKLVLAAVLARYAPDQRCTVTFSEVEALIGSHGGALEVRLDRSPTCDGYDVWFRRSASDA